MQELRFEGRVAVVTGAGNGMGRAHAIMLAERGAQVVVNDVGCSVDGRGSSPEPARAVADAIRRAGGTAVMSFADVASPTGAESIVQTAIDAFGRVDAVVHNAGISFPVPFSRLTVENFQQMLGVHLVGGFGVLRAAWPHMVEQRHGRVVLVTSTAGVVGMSELAHYAAAKTGMIGLANVMAIEGAQHGIRVNTLGVRAYTRMQQYFERAGGQPVDPRVVDWKQSYMRPDLVSSVVTWLAHEDCSISGEILQAGGGHVHRFFIGATQGYTNLRLTPEDVRDHLDEIRDPTRYGIYSDVGPHAMFEDELILAAGAPPPPSVGQ